MTEVQLEAAYEKNKDRFEKVLNFISTNRPFKENIDIIFNSTVLINKEPAREKIRLLFIDSLNAAGSSNLTRNGKACKFFNSKIHNLSSDQQIELRRLYECFDPSITNLKEFYQYLHTSKRIVNFGKKKAALFVYKLHRLQTILPKKEKMFTGYNGGVTDLIIPIDVVITFILNKLFKFHGTSILKQYTHFDLINIFFKKKLGEKFMLIEDLWFWGYFTTKGSGNKRMLQFNEAKFYTANFIKPTDENKQAILNFLKILKS